MVFFLWVVYLLYESSDLVFGAIEGENLISTSLIASRSTNIQSVNTAIERYKKKAVFASIRVRL